MRRRPKRLCLSGLSALRGVAFSRERRHRIAMAYVRVLQSKTRLVREANCSSARTLNGVRFLRRTKCDGRYRLLLGGTIDLAQRLGASSPLNCCVFCVGQSPHLPTSPAKPTNSEFRIPLSQKSYLSIIHKNSSSVAFRRASFLVNATKFTVPPRSC